MRLEGLQLPDLCATSFHDDVVFQWRSDPSMATKQEDVKTILNSCVV